MNIENILQSLSKIRPVFHSEADFQFSLAWHIQKNMPNAALRLEYPKVDKEHYRDNKRIYLDIFIVIESTRYGIELKYKTKKCELITNRESFCLNNQAAQDIGRYDYLKDIQRVEWFKSTKTIDIGYAIFLSNDNKYWQPASRQDTVDKDFRIHEGRKINHGTDLRWSTGASKGTVCNREQPINLKFDYDIGWHNYGDNFKYTYVEIKTG
jgi:hypothetical protein